MNTTSAKSLKPEEFKVNELSSVNEFLKSCTATATEVAVALNIYRPNVCRWKRRLEKKGQLAVIKKVKCPITKHWAALLTTDPDNFPIQSQLKLFSYE